MGNIRVVKNIKHHSKSGINGKTNKRKNDVLWNKTESEIKLILKEIEKRSKILGSKDFHPNKEHIDHVNIKTIKIFNCCHFFNLIVKQSPVNNIKKKGICSYNF
jgi:hypothetical protein